MADNDTRSQRDKAVDSALKQIERNFGKGAIMRLGSGEAAQDVPAISTGSLGLDIATGCGRSAPWPHHRNLRPRVFG